VIFSIFGRISDFFWFEFLRRRLLVYKLLCFAVCFHLTEARRTYVSVVKISVFMLLWSIRLPRS
jgi:hypothetical protein